VRDSNPDLRFTKRAQVAFFRLSRDGVRLLNYCSSFGSGANIDGGTFPAIALICPRVAVGMIARIGGQSTWPGSASASSTGSNQRGLGFLHRSASPSAEAGFLSAEMVPIGRTWTTTLTVSMVRMVSPATAGERAGQCHNDRHDTAGYVIQYSKDTTTLPEPSSPHRAVVRDEHRSLS
jgi:hypothetical protein